MLATTNCWSVQEVANCVSKRHNCSMCGICCRRLGMEIRMTPGDYRRWKHQGREDILRYAYVIPGRSGEGYLWFDPTLKLELDRCPFLIETGSAKYACAIQETKPKICKQFWCEWTYGEGPKGVPFKVAAGWTNKARQLGYGETRKKQAKQASSARRESPPSWQW